MTKPIEERLEALRIELPATPVAVANYLPGIQHGGLIFISGQLPLRNGDVIYQGKLGVDVDIETGQKAARLCALNLLSQVKALLGDFGKLERCVRLGGFVAAAPDFYDHPQVINGASDLMIDVMGDDGRHCRAAVGCSSLPLNAAVEVEAIFKVRS